MKLNKKISRRFFLRSAGQTVFWLPTLNSLPGLSEYAFAAGDVKKRFVAMLWPNGDGDLQSGNSTFHFNKNGLLENLNDLNGNIILPRGFSAFSTRSNAYDGNDVTHSNGNSYFLTGYSISDENTLLNAPSGTKSIDQYIADQIIAENAGVPIHSLVLGLTNSTTENHLPHNNGFARTISCSDFNRPIQTETSIQGLFDRLYGYKTNTETDDSEKNRKLSVIDYVYSDLKTIRSKVSNSDKEKLNLYMEQVRDLEKYINTEFNATACIYPDPSSFNGSPNLGNINSCFEYLRKMIDLVVLAHKCDLTRVTTITMDVTKGQIGAAAGAGASVYHRHHDAGVSNTYMQIVKNHVETVGYMIRRFKEEGLLEESVIFAGSDCKFGHINQNNPFIIGSAGSGLKIGQEIGNANSLRPSSDLLVDILKLYGINRANLGDYIVNSTAVQGTKDGNGTGNSGILT